MTQFAEFFQEEALLKSLEETTPTGDIVADFESEGKTLTLALAL